MKKSFLTICLIIFFALISTASADEINEIVLKADTYYGSREVCGSAETSVKLYEEGLEIDPYYYDTHWKLARVYKWLGDHAEEGEKIPLYEKGEKHAKDAIEVKEDGGEGHFYYGMLMGKIGEERGVLSSLFLVDPIKKEMEKCLEIEPGQGDAHIALSVLYRKAPGWPLSCGDTKKAKKHALKAIEYNPNRIRYYLELGRAYVSLGDYENARKVLEPAIDLPLEPQLIPEGKKDKKDAKKLLEEIEER